MGQTTTGKDEVVVFLQEVQREGVITDFTAETLLDYRLRQTRPPVEGPQTHPAFSPVRTPQPPAVSAPTAAAAPVPTPLPPPAPAFVPAPPRRRTRTEIWARYARKRSKKMWGTLSADFAANALTYLGVLIAVVVVFVFFAFGYFGDFIDADHKQFRPLAEIGVVAFFLGLAWVLRHRTGIPQTSAAIEMIGILLIPVMMSASFRDGCTPAYRPWCLPPDADGPARWAAYGLVALVSAGIYYIYARRRHIYSYLVGPMTWVAVGAFALYLDDGIRLVRNGDDLRLARFTSDGISSPQLIAVLAAIGISIVAANRIRDSRVGSVIAVPIVRSGVVFVPLVLLVSLVFAHNDAIARGVAMPGLADVAWPNVVATAIGALVFATASRARFAWTDLSQKLQAEMGSVLRTAAYLSLGASWIFAAGFGVTLGWLGTGLVAYSVVVAILDKISATSQGVWVVRLAALVGAALAVTEAGPATAAWGAIAAIVVLQSVNPVAAQMIARYVPRAESEAGRQIEQGAAVLIAIGAGPARLVWPGATSVVLLAAAALVAAARLVSNPQIRTLSGIPSVVLAAGAVGTEVWRQLFVASWDPYQLSFFLAAVAAVLAVTSITGAVRLAVSTGLLATAAGLSLREYLGNDLWSATWTDTTVLAVVGLALIGATFSRIGTPRSTAVWGHLYVGAALLRALPFEETAILGLAAVFAAYGLETLRIESGNRSVFSDVDWLPALVSLLAVAPLAILTARQFNFFMAEDPRFGPLLAVVAWAYLGVAAVKRRRIRSSALSLAYAASAAAILLGVPSVTAGLVTTSAAAALTATVAVVAKRPILTLPSWILALAATVLAASRMGLGDDRLHIALHLAALVTVLAGAALGRSRWSRPATLVGAVALPIALIASNGSWTAWLALSAAGAYAWLGWSMRIGLFSIPTGVGIAIGYAAILNGNGWVNLASQPIVWMPLAATLVAATMALPGNRRWQIFTDPAPGVLLTGLTIGGIALVGAAATDIALVCTGILLTEAYVVRRREVWLGAAAVAFVAAGLIAGGYWAPLATFALALVLGQLADRYRSSEAAAVLRALTVISLATTHVLVADWLQWRPGQFIIATAAVVGPVLIMALAAELRTSLRLRLRAWRTQLFWLSQAGAVAMVGVAASALSRSDAAGVLAGVAGFEALAGAVLGTIRRSAQINCGAALITAAAYSQLPIWLEWTRADFMAATGVIALALAVVATMATRAQADSPILRSWVVPLHGLVGGAALAVLAGAIAPEALQQDLWIAAGVLLGLGVHLSANAWAAPDEWQARGVAVASFLGSALCGIAAVQGGAASTFAVALIVAGIGLVMAIVAGTVAETDSVWRRELAVSFAGLEIVALGGLVRQVGFLAGETGVLLIVVGGALAAYGILVRRLELVEVAIVTWLAALVLLVNSQIGMSRHAAALTASVALLGVLELERVRYELEDAPLPGWLDQVEWILMLAAPVLAVEEMFGTLWFGFVLFGEGIGLAAWGAFTQVRRRALVGVAVMTAAILLAVAIPAIHGLMVGLAAGTWLAIGAVAAVVFIAAGSAIERQRHAIGRRLAHIGEILEHWN